MNGHVLNAAYAGFYVNEQYGKVMMIMTENGIEGQDASGWDDGTKKLAYIPTGKRGPFLEADIDDAVNQFIKESMWNLDGGETTESDEPPAAGPTTPRTVPVRKRKPVTRLTYSVPEKKKKKSKEPKKTNKKKKQSKQSKSATPNARSKGSIVASSSSVASSVERDVEMTSEMCLEDSELVPAYVYGDVVAHGMFVFFEDCRQKFHFVKSVGLC